MIPEKSVETLILTALKSVFALFLSIIAIATAYGNDIQTDTIRNNAIRHEEMGIEYMNLERYPESLDEFKIALALNPSSNLAASLYNNVGIIYQRQGFYSQACQAYIQASRLRPQFELFYKNLVQAYQESNTLEKAGRVLEEILVMNPTDAEGWFIYGLIREKQGQMTVARQAFLKFLQLQPHSQLAQAAEKHL